jgi:hypothetical protein
MGESIDEGILRHFLRIHLLRQKSRHEGKHLPPIPFEEVTKLLRMTGKYPSNQFPFVNAHFRVLNL